MVLGCSKVIPNNNLLVLIPNNNISFWMLQNEYMDKYNAKNTDKTCFSGCSNVIPNRNLSHLLDIGKVNNSNYINA